MCIHVITMYVCVCVLEYVGSIDYIIIMFRCVVCLFLAAGTGVPFHIHGPTFAETIFGRKVCIYCSIYIIILHVHTCPPCRMDKEPYWEHLYSWVHT